MFDDTQALFRQLAAVPEPQAVKTLIENHDAWSHGDLVESAAPWLRRHAANLDPARRARILQQRQTLAPLVTRLPARLAA